jgi:hypothetical protein
VIAAHGIDGDADGFLRYRANGTQVHGLKPIAAAFPA